MSLAKDAASAISDRLEDEPLTEELWETYSDLMDEADEEDQNPGAANAETSVITPPAATT